MKLITKEIERKLPALYSQDGKKPEDVKIIIKFFHCLGNYTWYITEGSKQPDGDWLFFGYARGDFNELGYFKLFELEKVSIRGVKVERDMYFGFDRTLAEAKEKQI